MRREKGTAMAPKFGKLTRLVAAVGTAVGLAGPAFGQQQITRYSHTNSGRAPQVEQRTVVELTDQGDEVRIVIEGDETEVRINQRDVPRGQVRRTGDVIEILDQFGRTDRILNVPLMTSAVDRSQPPVMLGVTLSTPDSIVREQLGLGDIEVVQIDSVGDGLPASRAGLKKFDLIVALEGERGVTRADITKMLFSKQPGDTVRFRVLRRGEERDIDIKLAAYDAEVLYGVPTPPTSPKPPLPPTASSPLASDSDFPQGLAVLRGIIGDEADEVMRTALESALHAIDSVEPSLPANVRGELDGAREQVERALEQLEARTAQGAKLRSFSFGRGDNFVLDNDRLIRVPDAAKENARAMQEEAKRRLAEVENRFGEMAKQRASVESLTDRLDELDERLSRFESTVDRLERLLDRMERRP